MGFRVEVSYDFQAIGVVKCADLGFRALGWAARSLRMVLAPQHKGRRASLKKYSAIF